MHVVLKKTTVHVHTLFVLFLPSDPLFIPDKVCPVFEAISGGWEILAGYHAVPEYRARLIRQQFDPLNQRREAGKYCALYDPTSSWRELSLLLYKSRETKALLLAKPCLQTVKGTYIRCILVHKLTTHMVHTFNYIMQPPDTKDTCISYWTYVLTS